MHTVFDEPTRDGLTDRIGSLHEGSAARWGKMNVNQMVRHCIMWDEVTLGKRETRRTLLSRMFGNVILKLFVKDDSPLLRYLPAVDELEVGGPVNSDLESEKDRWISLINEYPLSSDHAYEVPFFGGVTREQAGHLAYKHADHHLRQFSA